MAISLSHTAVFQDLRLIFEEMAGTGGEKKSGKYFLTSKRKTNAHRNQGVTTSMPYMCRNDTQPQTKNGLFENIPLFILHKQITLNCPGWPWTPGLSNSFASACKYGAYSKYHGI